MHLPDLFVNRSDANPESSVNILALMTDAYGGHGGIAQYNRDLLAGLSAVDNVRSIEALVRVRPGAEEPLPSKVLQSNPAKSRVEFSLLTMRSMIRQRPSIVFNGHLYHSGLSAIVSRLAGAKMISQLHGTEVWGAVPQHHLSSLVRSDLVLCVSRDTERQALRLAPALAGRTHVLHNTVDPRFSPRDRRLARARFGLGNQKVILTVARLDARGGYKGHDRILKLMPELAKRFPAGLVYLIAGDGPDRTRLSNLVCELGLQEFVRFLGRVPSEELPELYSAADVFAMPSTGEGFGIVYLEAMACGTPAIGLNVGGVPDAFGHGAFDGCVPNDAFEQTLFDFLDRPKTDLKALSTKVNAMFGASSFNSRLLSALTTYRILKG